MKLFLYGVEADSLAHGAGGASYLVQLVLTKESGEASAVIKTTSALPGAASIFADIVAAALAAMP